MEKLEPDKFDEETTIILACKSYDGEVWRRLKNLDKNGQNYDFSHYLISSFGRLINSKTWCFIKGSFDSGGYVKVKLTPSNDGSKKISYMLHRLVAFTFIGIPDDTSYTVDHIDRVRDFN